MHVNFYSRRRKMDIRNRYLDFQLCDKHLIYSIEISEYSAVISDIFILSYFNILYSENMQILQFNM